MSYGSNVAIAQIVEPAMVQARCASLDLGDADKGSIWVSIPELGLEGDMMVYCRYGLSIPYIKVQKGDKLWVEPTVDDKKRWKYTGFADCGGSITPDATMQLLIQWASQVIYATTNGTMHLSADDADEPFVLGGTFKTELDKHYQILSDIINILENWTVVEHDGGNALQVAIKAYTASMQEPDYSGILSEKIFGE